MKSIGGFLPLEVGDGQSAYHCGAAAMSSGRAGWHAILLARRPARVRLPFYICDAAIQPLVATGTPFEFYPIDEGFRPLIVQQDDADDIHLVVNYFGLLRPLVDRLASEYPAAVVVDDTQAFFRKGLPGACSFNSARKFFGVPDGSYVYGVAAQPLPPSDLTDCRHLITRLEGDADEAWQQFKRHEARIGIEPRAMSAVSVRLLAAVDMTGTRKTRAINFDVLHRRLGPINRIELTLDGAGDDGPMCYPFLPSALVDRTALAEAGLFVPALWPEVAARDQAGFDWERDIAERLLPLPIDHRYTPADMETVADRLLQVLA